MSLLPSGLWCDLCGKPIIEGAWWHCSVGGKPGHACEKCKEEWSQKREQAKVTASGDDE
jgi:hypothetical protein